MPASGREISDLAHWQSVREQVEEVAVALDQSASAAPTQAASAAAAGSASAVRAMASALESERLLLEGANAFTPGQAAEVEHSESASKAELDAALARLAQEVRPNTGPQ